MYSQLASDAEQQLIDAARRLTPAQRLAAFVEHNRHVHQLYRAGEQWRATTGADTPASKVSDREPA
jgi:hypothetical protein